MTENPGEVTRLLTSWRGGDDEARDRLMSIVYKELRGVAQRHMNLENGSTLQATALVNEAYLRLIDMDVPWQDRAHFFAVAAGLMRRILVDRARKRRAKKRGGDAVPVVMIDVPGTEQPVENLLILDEILSTLEAFDARKSKVLELKYFGGLTIPETAEVLGCSTPTVERDLRAAKAWILKQMNEERGQ